jgi:YHS domain-containing protein
MTRTIVFVIASLALVALLIGCGQKEEQSQVEEAVEEVQVASAKVVDPVCGMSIDAEAVVTAEHEGETYHFCSAQCKETFLEDPEKHMSEMPMEGDEEPQMKEEEGHEGHGH